LGANTSINSSSNDFQKSTAVGYGAQITESNQIVIGTSTEKVAMLNDLSLNNRLFINGDASFNANIELTKDSSFIKMGADKDIAFKHDGSNGMDLEVAGALDIDAGTAVSIDSTAGSITMGAVLADGQTLTLGKNGATEMVFTPHGTAASEKISLTNTAGDANDAIAVTATAGGMTFKVADEKDLILGNAGGDAYFKVAASATAGDEDLRIVNTNGTDNAAIELRSTAGGITGQFAADKSYTVKNATNDLSIVLTDDSSDAANEKITLTNTNGTDAESIKLLTAAGGIVNQFAADKSYTVKNATNDLSIVLTDDSSTAANEKIVLTNTNGTGADSINLESSAGGVLVSADGNIASAIKLHATVGGNQTIDVINTAGSGEGAITLTSTAGGVDIDAAAAKDVNIAGGQVVLASKDNAASAISLTANVGSSETIVVTNTQGNGEGAITLTSTAGGVDIDAAAAKDKYCRWTSCTCFQR
jgi:hypothetical protein